MTETWHLQSGNVQVVEDAETASLVIVGKELFSKQEKIEALQAILQRMLASVEKDSNGK